MECLLKCFMFQVFEEFSTHELVVSSTYIKKCEFDEEEGSLLSN